MSHIQSKCIFESSLMIRKKIHLVSFSVWPTKLKTILTRKRVTARRNPPTCIYYVCFGPVRVLKSSRNKWHMSTCNSVLHCKWCVALVQFIWGFTFLKRKSTKISISISQRPQFWFEYRLLKEKSVPSISISFTNESDLVFEASKNEVEKNVCANGKINYSIKSGRFRLFRIFNRTKLMPQLITILSLAMYRKRSGNFMWNFSFSRPPR